MNCALIFAGGTGQRMNVDKRPKQFLELYGKPIIIYTLEKFEYHSEIDGIVIACLEPWIPYLRMLVGKYGLRKVKSIVPGGRTGQESIYNAVCRIHELYADDTIVLVHDGVRPVIDEKLITANIRMVCEHGSSITVAPAIETITINTETVSNKVGKIIERAYCMMAKAPQCFKLGDLYEAHQRAQKEGLLSFVDSACLMQHYGYDLFTVVGSADNIKITTPIDFYMFKAIIDAEEASQIMGV